MKKTFVSNSQESTRMFKSDFLEAFSKVHFTVPLYIFIPVIVYFSWRAFAVANNTILVFIASFAAGLFFWTLTEYALHRFVFHFVPKSKWGLRLHFIFHGVHHDYPNDRLRLVMPPSVSIPLATAFYFLFLWLIPVGYVYGFFAAFITGYLIYDISHYAMHHFTFRNPIMKKIKQHHMQHHYAEPDRGYGVSSALWDKIFRSDFEK
ncbi:MAG TPA: sterol desaturase family protein [Ohtaekwangia sp.]|uniref:sterol desaturase family protein n=1 Tax=Ohtaekwangia sp. TaxID=2066019 RepID=UPI002F94AA51